MKRKKNKRKKDKKKEENYSVEESMLISKVETCRAKLKHAVDDTIRTSAGAHMPSWSDEGLESYFASMYEMSTRRELDDAIKALEEYRSKNKGKKT